MATVDLVKRLSKNFTAVISRDECSKHKELNWGKNGIGDRWCKRKFCYTSIYAKSTKLNNDKQDIVSQEPSIIQEFQKDFMKTHKVNNEIIGIFVHYELSSDDNVKRPIRKDIRKYITSQSCIICGSMSELVCDHKNDLYNDEKVLNTSTQLQDDFQCLCTHCNLQKRQICKNERKLKKLYSAKNILQLQVFEHAFPWEKKAYDENDPKLKDDTYWHDPIEFMRKIKLYNKITIPIIKELKRKIQKNIITKVE